MAAKEVVSGIYAVPLGIVNAFLLRTESGLVLIDTGVPESEGKILDAIREIGMRPEEVERILVTHLHADHTGSLSAVKEATGAPAVMHPLDAEVVRRGETMRPAQPGPGLINKLLGLLMAVMPRPSGIEPVEIEEEVIDGDEVVGGLRVVHVPGHAAGQVALLWPEEGGVLFVADAATNMLGLGYAPIYEDMEKGRASLSRLAALDFDVACFGHGKAIVGGAAARFREKWGQEAIP